jgi:hypothetical protein
MEIDNKSIMSSSDSEPAHDSQKSHISDTVSDISTDYEHPSEPFSPYNDGDDGK